MTNTKEALYAKMYAWLRQQHWSNSPMAVVMDPKRNVELGAYCPSEELLDEKILTALRIPHTRLREVEQDNTPALMPVPPPENLRLNIYTGAPGGGCMDVGHIELSGYRLVAEERVKPSPAALEKCRALLLKHGICEDCGEMYSHDIDAPFASCNCKQSEWYELTPYMQLQKRLREEESRNATVSAVQFAISCPDGLDFLRLWNEGEFETLRKDWPEAPEEVYIGADPLHPKTMTAQEKAAAIVAQWPEWKRNYQLTKHCSPQAPETFAVTYIERREGGPMLFRRPLSDWPEWAEPLKKAVEEQPTPPAKKYMPIHSTHLSIPMEMLNEEWARKNHNQSLDRLAERGGLAAYEALDIIKRQRFVYGNTKKNTLEFLEWVVAAQEKKP